MKLKDIFGAAVLAAVLLAAPTPAPAAKPVMVHYMPWFQSELFPASGYWGNHWLMPNFNPDTILPNGQRNIASWYYPLIGPYDSLDPAVLEYHVLLMKLGGIDGVIADWYGSLNFYDYGTINDRTSAIVNWTRKAGLKFAVCYESSSSTNNINNAEIAMQYLQTNNFADPSYLRLNGKPVVLAFGNPPAYYSTSSQWTTIFSVLASSNQPAFFTEDNRISPVAQGGFSWPPVFNGQTVSAATIQTYINNFTSKGGGWTAYIDAAFPRFHDIYGQAGGTTRGYLDDANGSIFTNTLTHAMTDASSVIQIATWNDFGEGTIIEPTVQYGYRDLGVVQDLRRKYLDATFPYTTNDVALATRLYNLRTNYNNYPAISAEMNRIFTNLCTGNLTAARKQMSGIEANVPVLYNFSFTDTQVSFNIGGYLPFGAQVLSTTNLIDWQTAQSFPGSTTLPTFTANIAPNTHVFYRVQ